MGLKAGPQKTQVTPSLWASLIIEVLKVELVYSWIEIFPSEEPHKRIRPYSWGQKAIEFTAFRWFEYWKMTSQLFLETSFHIKTFLSKDPLARRFPNLGWAQDRVKTETSCFASSLTFRNESFNSPETSKMLIFPSEPAVATLLP